MAMDLYQIWIDAIEKISGDNLRRKNKPMICNLHFRPEDCEKKRGRNALKSGVIPSVPMPSVTSIKR